MTSTKFAMFAFFLAVAGCNGPAKTQSVADDQRFFLVVESRSKSAVKLALDKHFTYCADIERREENDRVIFYLDIPTHEVPSGVILEGSVLFDDGSELRFSSPKPYHLATLRLTILEDGSVKEAYSHRYL